MSRDFDDLVDAGGLAPGERRRLHRVHDLLVSAGPPPELTAALEHPPRPVVDVRPLGSASSLRRRRLVGALIAAAIVVACFGGGYALGNRSDDGGAVRVVPMQGVSESAHASVSLGAEEPGGNWPIELRVSGLPELTTKRSYYELFVTRDGKPSYPCGGFKMSAGTTTVRFSVPYELKEDTSLVVTAIGPGKSWPGQIVMTTA
jgi:hypothetical protein